jgi:Secretion system C-terminal sorting domain
MTKYLFVICLSCCGLSVTGQSFYVTSPVYSPLGNKTYLVDIADCHFSPVFTCVPTNDTSEFFQNEYTDIAYDKMQNLWDVSGWGSLYKRSLADTTSCEYVGSFTTTGAVNALAVDSNGTVYAAGNAGGVCTLYKYDSTGFSTLGNFPAGMFSSGDLFFYENRLFMTGTNSVFSEAFLVEVALPDPALSCNYMSLYNLQAYGAFSLAYGTVSKAYIMTTDGTSWSSVIEIDIPGRSITGVVCSVPFVINGAATYYARTSDHTACVPEVAPGAISVEKAAPFCKTLNPAGTKVRINTNISPAMINKITLYDLAGRKVKDFATQDFPDGFDISDLSNGMYILEVVTNDGRQWNGKVVKSAGW